MCLFYYVFVSFYFVFAFEGSNMVVLHLLTITMSVVRVNQYVQNF